MISKETPSSCRLDRWLWAARFFKTRGLAKAALEGGKVRLNGSRAKPAKLVKPGDALEITRGEAAMEIRICAIGERRVSAELAQKMYQESPASVARREALIEQQRLKRQTQREPDRRPGKRDRRLLRQFKGR